MKSTLLKLTIVSLFGAILIGCASSQPAADQNVNAAANTQRGPLNNGNGLVSAIH